MGRYVPPEHEGVISANALNKKKAPGSRAGGVQTVRFEMPFPIWCTTCPKPTIIGQGVRFNAEKKKVGAYYSTPIYSFRMKHVACGGWIEIRTDPQNTAYVVTEGARKRDLGDDVVKEGDYEIMTTEEREKIRENAFSNLEFKKVEVERAKGARERIEDLQKAQDEMWEDPYERNKRLRAAFRKGRHERERDAQVTGALQDRMSLGIPLLPATREDELRAGLAEFDGPRKPKRLKAEVAREAAVSSLRANIRAKSDPFLSSSKLPSKPNLGIKRKRSDDARRQSFEQPQEENKHADEPSTKVAVSKPALVAYGSDSE